jgi:hypothetical protein
MKASFCDLCSTAKALSKAQAIALASELNHILWTADTPTLPGYAEDEILRRQNGNIQCCAHALISAGLMLIHGDKVVTRAGSAIVVYPEENKGVSALFIAQHWWLTTSKGATDLSINLKGLTNSKPIVFENINLMNSDWKIGFKDDFLSVKRDAEKWALDGGCGVFYHTESKRAVAIEDIEQDMNQLFPPRQNGRDRPSLPGHTSSLRAVS